jgi:hypothetical protein
MPRNNPSLPLWQFLMSCHLASEHDRDRSTEKLRGHTFGARVLPQTVPPLLINKSP